MNGFPAAGVPVEVGAELVLLVVVPPFEVVVVVVVVPKPGLC